MDGILPDNAELTEEWTNYGDVNPRRHGGLFLKWDADDGRWYAVETTHPDDIGDAADGRHMVQETEIHPAEVVESPTEWADAAEREVDSLSNLPDPEHYPPEGAAADGRLEYIVAGAAREIRGGESDWVDDADYWNHLAERHDIDPDEYRD